MMNESQPSRRGFIVAAAATAVVGGYAAAKRGGSLGVVSQGTISLAVGRPLPIVPDTASRWHAAVGTSVRIAGERGLVEGRIISVTDDESAGVRPANVRPQGLIVQIETNIPYAPVGNAVYGVESAITAIRELFLVRGQDVFDKAILIAILN